MPLDKRNIESSLISKGFKKKKGKTHLRLIYCDEEGNKTGVATHMSYGSYKEIDDKLVSDMARQCRLSNNDFINLVGCSLSHEDYDQYLRSIDVIG